MGRNNKQEITPIEDYSDKKNSNWNIISAFKKEDRRTYFDCECKCGCGQHTIIRIDQFNKSTKKCDKQKENQKKAKENQYLLNHTPRETYKTRLIGRQYGNLKVLDFAGYNKNKQILYQCECQCENHTIVMATYTDLESNKKDNCGCLTSKKQHDLKKRYNTYDLTGEFGIGYTFKGEEFWFDLEDYDKIKNYCWSVHDKYIVARDENGKHIRMHRIIMGITDPYVKVDHIFHHEYDNRKSELRLATNQENTFNHVIHSNNTSGASGVNWDSEKNLWRARIFIESKGIHLGYFSDFNEAIAVRLEAEEKYFGDFQYKEVSNE